MSLKYRLIILTIAVFAITFAVGSLLGVHAARGTAEQLAQSQLRSHLQRTAVALADSSAPLNNDVLARLAPLLEVQVLVMAGDGRLVASSPAALPVDRLRRALLAAEHAAVPETYVKIDGRRFHFNQSPARVAATNELVWVYVLGELPSTVQTSRVILLSYLAVLGITSVLLAIGMYVVGMRLVNRINRLHAGVDETLAEEPGPPATWRGRGDELQRLAAAFDDLRARLQRSRERLVAQQRLATTGKLASSIAHEVRNPLQAIRLIIQMMRAKADATDRQGLDLVLGEIDRLALLTDELLVLAGKDTLAPQPVDLARLLRETTGLLEFQFRQREIRIDIDLPADLPPVLMDPNRCRQLLLNLLLNAGEASPRGGTVRVTGGGTGTDFAPFAKSVPVPGVGIPGDRETVGPENRTSDFGPRTSEEKHGVSPTPEVRSPMPDARRSGVVIRIADNGPGFPQAVLVGQAEEFFSTKSSGAGLGLSICRRIVEEAGGRLSLYNTDAGAVAEVALPKA